MGRPLSGKTAPQGRMSLIDRVAGGSYTPPAPQPLAMPRQLETVSAPEKNNEVKPAAEAVAAPKKAAEKPVKKPAEKKTIVSEADEVEAHKKKLAQEKIDKDILAYKQKKAQEAIAARLKNKK